MLKSLIMIKECFGMSLSNIRSNKMRSFLTVLGILIGVSAVIALITTVSGFSGTLSSSFLRMGAGTLTVSVSGSDLKSGLNAEDIAELTALDEVEGITPTVSLRSRVSRGGEYKTNVSISGKNAYYFYRNDTAVSRGRAIHPTDESSSTFVCLINQTIVDELFFGVDPIGENMYIDGIPFLVIGILADDAGESISNIMSGSTAILIPYTTALKMNNSSDVTNFTVYLAEGVDSEAASSRIDLSIFVI